MQIIIESLVTFKQLTIDLLDYSDTDELTDLISESFNDDEWRAVNYEDMPFMGDHPDLEDLLTIASALDDCHDQDALIAYIMMNGADYFQDSIDNFEDAYCGQHDSLADYAEELVSDCYNLEIPSFVVIDWQATWDCNLRHDYQVSDDNHVFRNI